MQRPPIKLIRRILLLVMAGVLLASVGFYAVRRWQFQQARQSAPAPLPVGVEQQTEKFSFSQSEGSQTLFTIEAARSIEQTSETMVLENVNVVLYGKEGDREDKIQASRCTYDRSEGEIFCPGEVIIVLHGGNSEEASEVASESLQIITSGVRFNAEQEAAWTEGFVRFAWPKGEGQAVGLRYDSRESSLELEKEVELTLKQKEGDSLAVRGAGLKFQARTRSFELGSPLAVQFAGGGLQAGRLRVQLDEQFRTERFEAEGRVRVQRRQAGEAWKLEATRLVVDYAEGGGMTRMEAFGPVDFSFEGAHGNQRVTAAGKFTLQFHPGNGRLWQATARDDAGYFSSGSEQTVEVRGQTLEMEWPPQAEGESFLRARERGELRVTRKTGLLEIAARFLEVRMGGRRFKNLGAEGNVAVRDERPGRPVRRTSSENLHMDFSDSGELIAARQSVNFRFESDRWQAQAGRARYSAEGSVFHLEENPSVRDSSSRTTAGEIEIREGEGILYARGGVRTTLSKPKAGGGPGSGPIHLAAKELTAHREQGWIRYQGEARLWEGENRLAADIIEWQPEPWKVLASGNVSAFLREAPAEEGGSPVVGAGGGSPQLIRIDSKRFSYSRSDRLAVFEQSVTVSSRHGLLRSPRLEVKFMQDSGEASGRLEWAHASGGVRTELGTRYILSEEVEYNVVEGTMVFLGGVPTLHDPKNGSTSASRLTLFLANDTILAESKKGTRTVTRRLGVQ